MNEMEFCFKKIKITEPLAPLDLLVHFTKKAYIPGRFISEATKNTYDTIEQAIRTNNSGLAVLVNFEKVFNSVSFKFIQKTLNFLGLSWVTLGSSWVTQGSSWVIQGSSWVFQGSPYVT